MKLEKIDMKMVGFLAAYALLVLYVASISPLTGDEGSHSLLGSFYLGAAGDFSQNFSLTSLQSYAINFLIQYPKISVYYPPFPHFIISLFFLVLGKSFFFARMATIASSVILLYVLYWILRKSDYSVMVSRLTIVLISVSLPFIYSVRGILMDAQIALLSAIAIF